MLDFLMISERSLKYGVVEIYPRFIICKSNDLMIKASDFYAIWDEEQNKWCTDEQDAIRLIDTALDKYAKEKNNSFEEHIKIMHLWDAETGYIDKWHNYCKKQMRDNFKNLNNSLVFLNQKTTKEDYSSKCLPYALEKGNCDAWDELVSTLYLDEERIKIEWSIGAIVTGASKYLEKFLVLYGAPGAGKGTILKIIQELFKGYYAVFSASSLGSASNQFALEQFKKGPLVAFDFDCDLSKIEKNETINSIVSHEEITVNEKHKSLYSMAFSAFLFAASNKYVKITDGKSGLMRRLIDVHPSGNLIPRERYKFLKEQVKFELGHIAYKCKTIYENNPDMFDDYRPMGMLEESNDFFNFIDDCYIVFSNDDGTTLKAAWDMYKQYCEDSKVRFPFSKREFKAELADYFRDYDERKHVGDDWVRHYYSGFKKELFEKQKILKSNEQKEKINNLIEFKEQPSKLDILCQDYPAQYANKEGTPINYWSDIKTTLKDISSSELHYLKLPENHIVIDFDLKDEQGNKSYELNLKEASKWPKTYAELSKSGAGIHLHYIYNGDVKKLNRLYADDIEIKIFNGNSSLRRKLTKCNSEEINTISSGLPFKGERKMISSQTIQDDKHLRNRIMENLHKKYGSTAVSINYIYNDLEEAYNSGIKYDVTNMYDAILNFAAASTHQSEKCIKKVMTMKFKSEDDAEFINNAEAPIVFYDVEVFPNLFLVNWKILDVPGVNRMINPSPTEIETLFKYRLVGFNNRSYDNHMIYARHLGYSCEQLFKLSRSIIDEGKGKFGAAYNLSYTDIRDYSGEKQSLKKWEIELELHHKELGYDWNQPVPEEKWIEVAEYCDNDVISTEAVWNATQEEFLAREILADITGMTVNDTTNSIATKLIFGNEKHPQLVYTDLSKEFPGYEYKKCFDAKGKVYYANMYRGTDLGFGGYAKGNPGIYYGVGLLDVLSMHPHTIIALNLFGEYTINYKNLVDARAFIKHGDFESAGKLFDGKLKKYLTDPAKAKKLSKALKTAINSVYGLTSAKFDNPFRDPRNVNNIVALRGALFMRTLEDEVKARGFKVAHIKTDSIKIPNMTEDIKNFCMEFARKYGYEFEHEATYDRMCIVNDAVYIARGKEGEHAGEWTATGAQFQIPYVFKKCFTKEPIKFRDLCVTKEVLTAMYLDLNEGKPDVSIYEKLKNIRLNVKKENKKLTKKEETILHSYFDLTDDEVEEKINEGHAMKFVGKVGLFCPIKPGCNGGLLLRKSYNKDGSIKYDSVGGTVGYRWLEAEDVQAFNKQSEIDLSYHDDLVNKAIETINKYGDYYQFVNAD